MGKQEQKQEKQQKEQEEGDGQRGGAGQRGGVVCCCAWRWRCGVASSIASPMPALVSSQFTDKQRPLALATAREGSCPPPRALPSLSATQPPEVAAESSSCDIRKRMLLSRKSCTLSFPYVTFSYSDFHISARSRSTDS